MMSLVKHAELVSVSEDRSQVSELDLSRRLMSLKPESPNNVITDDVGEDAIKSYSQSHLLSPIDKCKICGEPAARHIHYGGVSCYSCRAFFRRSIQNKTARTYVCRRSKQCQINKQTRKNCQYCRYQKCLGVGMKPNWVLTKDERERRFRKSKAKKLKTEDDASSDQVVLTREENVLFMIPGPNQMVSKALMLQPVNIKHETMSEMPDPSIDQNLNAECAQVVEGAQSLPLLSAKASPCATAVPVSSLSSLVTDTPNGNQVGSTISLTPVSSSQRFVKLCYPSNGNSPIVTTVTPETTVTRWYMSPDSEPATPAPLDLSGDEDNQSVYSRTSGSERDEPSPVNVVGIYSEPDIKFSQEELFTLNKMVEEHDLQYRSISFGEQLIKEIIMCSMFGIPITQNAALSGYKLTVARIQKIADHLDTFKGLTTNDQTILLKENADLLVSLRGAIFFDSRKRGVNQVLVSMGVEDMESIKTMFAPLIRDREQSLKYIEYSNFNSIQKVEKSPTEQRYNFLQSKVAETIGDDTIISVLLTYIILYSPDFCSLQQHRRIEMIQEQYIRMLERYISMKSVGPSANAHDLAATLENVTRIREMADIKKNRAFTQQQQ